MNLDFITPELLNLRAQFRAEGFEIRLVGGCVRDMLAGHTPKDIDLCTNADPQEQIALYQQHGHRHALTGIDHGTITVVLNGEPYEITSLRLDVATDGRRATVAYTRDWLKDLERRDLTINAMSMDFEGVLFDPFGGAEHLKKGIVRFVGNSGQRIQEDYLRILRWFRFQARFGTDNGGLFMTSAWRAICKNKQGLEQISAERVWNEIKALLKHDRGANMLRHMDTIGVGAHIKLPPKRSRDGADGEYQVSQAAKWTQAPEVLMAAWCGWHVDVVNQLADDWKWSRAERDHVNWLLNTAWTGADLRKQIAIHDAPREWVRELAHWEDRDEWEKNALVEWVFPPFPVNGNDLMACGIKPGKIMGVIINTLKDEWAASGFTATREDLMQMVVEMGHV